MNSKIAFKVENGILACFITGERSTYEALEYWSQLLDKCKREKLSRIQVNLAIKGRFSPFEAINNYQSIIEMVKQVKLKIALVDLNQISATDTQVGCNMGASQGLNIRCFGSEQKARNWLLADYNNLNKIA